MGRKAISGARGKRGRVFIGDTAIGANELCVTSWEVTETAEEEEVTNSCSGEGNEYEYGSIDTDFSIEMDWDIDDNVMDDPPRLRAGQTVHCILYIHSSPADDPDQPDGPFYEFDGKVATHTLTVPGKGRVRYTVSGKASGTVTRPTGTVSSSG